MDYQEKLFQESKYKTKLVLCSFKLILNHFTSRCSGRKVNRVRFGASNETGDELLFV